MTTAGCTRCRSPHRRRPHPHPRRWRPGGGACALRLQPHRRVRSAASRHRHRPWSCGYDARLPGAPPRAAHPPWGHPRRSGSCTPLPAAAATEETQWRRSRCLLEVLHRHAWARSGTGLAERGVSNGSWRCGHQSEPQARTHPHAWATVPCVPDSIPEAAQRQAVVAAGTAQSARAVRPGRRASRQHPARRQPPAALHTACLPPIRTPRPRSGAAGRGRQVQSPPPGTGSALASGQSPEPRRCRQPAGVSARRRVLPADGRRL